MGVNSDYGMVVTLVGHISGTYGKVSVPHVFCSMLFSLLSMIKPIHTSSLVSSFLVLIQDP